MPQKYEIDWKGITVLSDDEIVDSKDWCNVSVRIHQQVLIILGQERLNKLVTCFVN